MSIEGTGSRGHTGHSDNGQKCADFTVTSANGSRLTDHNPNRSRHLREPCKYKCTYCGSEFTDRHRLLHHVTTIHGSRRFVCPQCQRSYDTKYGLKQHVDGMHKKLYRYRCGTCGKGFFVPSLYHDHVAAHTGVNFHPNEEANIL